MTRKDHREQEQNRSQTLKTQFQCQRVHEMKKNGKKMLRLRFNAHLDTAPYTFHCRSLIHKERDRTPHIKLLGAGHWQHR